MSGGGGGKLQSSSSQPHFAWSQVRCRPSRAAWVLTGWLCAGHSHSSLPHYPVPNLHLSSPRSPTTNRFFWISASNMADAAEKQAGAAPAEEVKVRGLGVHTIMPSTHRHPPPLHVFPWADPTTGSPPAIRCN
jgi:hypothetical protein